MYPYLTQRIAAQRETELREQAAASRHARQVLRVRQASPASAPGRSHPMRRRAGYALISIGLRLAYAAGED